MSLGVGWENTCHIVTWTSVSGWTRPCCPSRVQALCQARDDSLITEGSGEVWGSLGSCWGGQDSRESLRELGTEAIYHVMFRDVDNPGVAPEHISHFSCLLLRVSVTQCCITNPPRIHQLSTVNIISHSF